MTAAEFCRDCISVKPSVFAPLPADRSWLVRFRYSLRGEAPQIAQETVTKAHSEHAALRAGITQRLGHIKRALHELTILTVRPL